ncbi:MAG: hypothetical protein PHQ86_06940 [Dehalococcoidales bacterium]|nr:hypothetical protein [Dehalococcoidales bacterium]
MSEEYIPKSTKKTLSTGVKSLDILLEGGIPRGLQTGVFSGANIGKSFLARQIGCFTCLPEKLGGLEQPVLVIDTEGDYEKDVMDRTYEIFSKRWNVPKSQFSFDIIKAPKIQELVSNLGADMKIDNKTESGKLDVHFVYQNTEEKQGKQKVYKDYYESSNIFSLVEKNKYPLIILDSLSEPIKSAFPPSVYNFPARSYVFKFILTGLRTIAQKFNTSVFITNHVSKSDMNYMDKGSPFGAESLMYSLKSLLYIRRGKSEQQNMYGKQVRRVELYRLSMKLEEEILLSLKDNYGFAEVSE